VLDLIPNFQRYVFESSSLINLERRKMVRRLPPPGRQIIVPQKVAEEVRKKGSPLAKWLSQRRARTENFVGNESAVYLRLRRQTAIHDGEASAIAIASCRKYTLVIDETNRAVLRKAGIHGVRTIEVTQFVCEFWYPLL